VVRALLPWLLGLSLAINLAPFYLRWRDRKRMERLLDGMR
jgi:hypothetical protein